MSTADGIDLKELHQMIAAMPITYRMSRVTLFGPLAMASMLGVLAGGVMLTPRLTMGLVAPGVAALAVAGLAGALALHAWIRWRSVALVVETTRISYRTGIMTRYARVVSISQVVGVDLAQALGGQQMGLGSLVVTTTGSETLYCPNMERCHEIAYLITHLADANRTLGRIAAAREPGGR